MPLVPLIVLLLVRSPLSYMQIKSLFASSSFRICHLSLPFRRSLGCRWTISLIMWSVNCHLIGCPTLSGCKHKSSLAPACFSFFCTGCIQTFLVHIHSLPRMLQQLTMGWTPGFNLPTPFHCDHTSFHTYYWEGSGGQMLGSEHLLCSASKELGLQPL